MAKPLHAPSVQTLHDDLQALPGVHRALVDGPPYRIDLICAPEEGGLPVEARARALLARAGVPQGEAELRISYVAAPEPRRRVRFVGLEVTRPNAGTVVYEVRLEWEKLAFEGRAEGEGGTPGELRTCALATLRALEAVLGGQATFSLVGVKGLRIFDHDLVAVLLHSDDAPARRLIGVSLVQEDHSRAAVLAVLNATNRLLGNFLNAAD